MGKKTISEKLRDAPRIDHSLLSPNGKISRRTRRTEMEKCFGGENSITLKDIHDANIASIQPSDIDRLERQAKQCREFAARGMRPRAGIKQAEWCEARIKELKAESGK